MILLCSRSSRTSSDLPQACADASILYLLLKVRGSLISSRRRSFPVPCHLEALLRALPRLHLWHLSSLPRSWLRPRTMTMLRPSRRGCCSIEPSSFTSSASRMRRSRPRSGWSVSRPRNMIVTLTLARWPEKAHDVPLLGPVVVDPDLRSELDLLDVDLLLVLSGLLGALILLVAVLRVVHDPRDGRICAGCDLDEVEPLAVRELERFLRREDPHLAAHLVHEPDALGTDLLVDSLVPLARSPAGRDPAYGGEVSKALHQALSFLLVHDKNRCTQRLRHLVQPARLNLRESSPGGEEAMSSACRRRAYQLDVP